MGVVAFKYPIVLITWTDAETDHGWQEVKDLDLNPDPAVTIGFLVTEDGQYITLASSYSGESVNNTIMIPKKMVVKKTIIRK